MIIPFLQRNMLLLEPSADRLVWTHVCLWIGRPVRIESGVLTFDGGVAWDRVAAFIEERQWGRAQVAVRLDSMYVRNFVLQGPAAASTDEFDRWVQREIALRLPAGADLKDFVFRARVLDQDEEVLQCMVGLTRRDYVDRMLAEVQAAGISPVALCGPVAEPAPPAPNPSLDTCLLSDISAFSFLPRQELEATGIDSNTWCLNDGSRRQSSTALSAGVTARAVSAGAYDFNFLDIAYVKNRIRSDEKKQARDVVFISGGALAVLMVVLFGLDIWLMGRLSVSENDLRRLGSQTAVLERQRKNIQDLELKLKQAERFVGERTATAEIFSSIGRIMPERAWLDEFAISKDGDAQWKVFLQGAALEEKSIVLLLRRLEEIEHVHDVELLMSEAVQTSRLYKHEPLRDRHVTRFQISLKLPLYLRTSRESREVS